MPTDKLEDFILNHQEDFNEEQPPAGLFDRIASELDDDDDDYDPLESFVLDNRDAFDEDTPPPRLEEMIFASMDAAGATPLAPAVAPATGLRVAHSRRRHYLRVAGLAATFLLLLFAAFTVGNRQGYQSAEEDYVASELQRINPELAEAEVYYRGEIEAQFTKVKQVHNDPQLIEDMAAIDAATAEIRANLLEVPVSQRPALVTKLIETYRTKLDILLRIQQQLPPPAADPATTPQQPTNDL